MFSFSNKVRQKDFSFGKKMAGIDVELSEALLESASTEQVSTPEQDLREQFSP